MFNLFFVFLFSITLSWKPNKENDLAGYSVYQTWNVNCFEDLPNYFDYCATTWKYRVNDLDTFFTAPYIDDADSLHLINYYAVTALDTANNESKFSRIVFWSPDTNGVIVDTIIPNIDPTPVSPNPTTVVFDTINILNDTIQVEVYWQSYVDTMATALKLWDTVDDNFWENDSFSIVFYDISPADTSIKYYRKWISNQHHYIRMQAVNRRHLNGQSSYFSILSYIDYDMPIKIIPDTTISSIHWLGDLNNDCIIDGLDQVILSSKKGKTMNIEDYDLNHDGIIDGLDQIIMSVNKGKICNNFHN